MRKLQLLFLLVIFYASASAQFQVSGRIMDTTEKKPLTNAVVSLLQKSDSTLARFSRTDKNGNFNIPNIQQGKYIIFVTYPKFANLADDITVKGNTDLGKIALTPTSILLKEVVIRSGQAIRIKGDTTEFTADSFVVKEGATVEDLLKKLPGFQVNSKGEITAQGKRVEKVLVDGEEFFGDDPTMATQNLSAKIVDKVQVYDTKTDQQQLTGISSGTEGKTVNIRLKEDKKKGAFGKAIAGSNFEDLVDAKLLFNRFTGKKKISVYGTRSDLNTGSLNWEDRQKMGMEQDMEFDEIGGFYYSFGNNDEFSDWSLRGLPQAYTAGGLYSNKWAEDKHGINLSYRYNRLATDNEQKNITQNLFPSISYRNKYTNSLGLNEQHAVNGKYEWKMDSLTSFKFITNGIYKKTDLNAHVFSEFLNQAKSPVNQSTQLADRATERLQNDNSLQYKQMFNKKNRLLIATLRFGVTEDDQDAMMKTSTQFYDVNGNPTTTEVVDQMKLFQGSSTTIGGKVTFSEPITSKLNLVVDYGHNRNNAHSYRNTFNRGGSGKYDKLDSAFSNNFDMNAYSHSSMAVLRYIDKKFRLAGGMGVSGVNLNLVNIDSNIKADYKFLNLTPQAQASYTIKTQETVSFNYRGTTRQPSIDQLQPLRDNNDPLYEFKGNPDLKVGFTHSFSTFYNRYKVLSGTGLWVNLSYNVQKNAITTNAIIDTVLGKRFSTPVNINGNSNWNFWSNWNKNRGEKKLNYGVQFNGNGGRYSNYINNFKNTTKFTSVRISVNTNYQNEEKRSFELRPELGYNNSLTEAKDRTTKRSYFSYGGYVSGMVMLPGKFELSSNCNFDLQGEVDAFGSANNIILWNASLSRKILKDKSGKIMLVANDILDQNKGYTRNISSSFVIEDSYSRISQYFLLKLEWSFSKMPGATK